MVFVLGFERNNKERFFSARMASTIGAIQFTDQFGVDPYMPNKWEYLAFFIYLVGEFIDYKFGKSIRLRVIGMLLRFKKLIKN